jgi:predicted nuclease of restriction endonuclease-like (RecB) superfamily
VAQEPAGARTGADEKLAPLVREIARPHNIVIPEKRRDPLAREFYIRATQRFGWTRNILGHRIEKRTCHKTPPEPATHETTSTPPSGLESDLPRPDRWRSCSILRRHVNRSYLRLAWAILKNSQLAMDGGFFSPLSAPPE